MQLFMYAGAHIAPPEVPAGCSRQAAQHRETATRMIVYSVCGRCAMVALASHAAVTCVQRDYHHHALLPHAKYGSVLHAVFDDAFLRLAACISGALQGLIEPGRPSNWNSVFTWTAPTEPSYIPPIQSTTSVVVLAVYVLPRTTSVQSYIS
jgi:hypothetical protein